MRCQHPRLLSFLVLDVREYRHCYCQHLTQCSACIVIVVVNYPRLVVIAVVDTDTLARVYCHCCAGPNSDGWYHVDTRSPSPNIVPPHYTHVQGQQGFLTPFREDSRHRPTSVCPPHLKPTRENHLPGAPPRIGVVGLPAFITNAAFSSAFVVIVVVNVVPTGPRLFVT